MSKFRFAGGIIGSGNVMNINGLKIRLDGGRLVLEGFRDFRPGGSSVMNINGLQIRLDGDRLVIDGIAEGVSGEPEKVVVDKDHTIPGNIPGDVEVRGENITLIVEGDVEGNIAGAASIEVKGDVEGNIAGAGSIHVKGDVEGNIVGCSFD